MRITRGDDGAVTVELSAGEAENLQDHLLWDDYANDGTVAGQLWEGLSESVTTGLDSSQPIT